MAWSLGFWHWNLAIAIFRSTPRDHILHGLQMVGPSAATKKKSICPSWLLGALWSFSEALNCEYLRKRHQLLAGYFTSHNGASWNQNNYLQRKSWNHQTQNIFTQIRIELKIMSKDELCSGCWIIWIVSRVITILVLMELEQAMLHWKKSGMLWVLMCLGVCKWKLIMNPRTIFR